MATRSHQLMLHRAAIPGIIAKRLAAARRSYSPHIARSRRTVNARTMWKIDRVLTALFQAGRRSIAILDTGCATGKLLVRTVLRAREIGFVAIEAKGLDLSPTQVAVARDAASAIRDPAIGLDFTLRKNGEPLPIDEDETFDLTLVAEADEDEIGHEIKRVTWPEGHMIRRD